MRTRHRCIGADRRKYGDLIRQESDAELLRKMSVWKEFQKPLSANTKVWRVYCGLCRREAAERGLEVPAPKEGA